MKMVTVHKGILEIVKRLPSSKAGNPRFMVRLDGYTAATLVDSMDGYEVQNLGGKMVTAEIGTHYGVRSIQYVRRVN
jgi:hypothetical protein